MKPIVASKRLIGLCLVTLTLGFSLAGGEARGQTTGPNPTATAPPTVSPTATPSIPSGQALLNQMQTALAAKNTFHFTGHLKLGSPHFLRQVSDSQGDESLRPSLEHQVATIRTTQLDKKPVKTKTEREETIVVRKRQATRTGKKQWRCSAAPSAFMPGQPPSGSDTTVTSRSVQNRGAETVGTVPVWHVREAITEDLSGLSVPVTNDYYIAQADFTLVRQSYSSSLTISIGKETATTSLKLVLDYTRYGETVKARLPTVCAGR